ncbi:MAG: GFA family protein [Dichotomicrobium sp.]
MTELQSYTGGCQCGAVRYEVALELGQVNACNCSRCARLGSLFAFTPAENFKLLSGEDAMADYQFNNKRIHHLFCATCGIESFARGKGPDGSEMVAINARCLDGVDPDSLTVNKIDGKSF